MASIPGGIQSNPIPKSEQYGSAEEFKRAVISYVLSLDLNQFDSYESYVGAISAMIGNLSFNERLEVQQLLTKKLVEAQDKARQENSCAYFDVREFNVVLPEGGGASQWVDRMQGDQLVVIIDANKNGVPDSGDTGIARDGTHYENVQLSGAPYRYEDIGRFPISSYCEMGGCGQSGQGYEVRRVEEDSMEYNAMVYSTNLLNQAAAVGRSVSDNKEVVGAITFLSLILLAHPKTRPVMAAILEFVGVTGGAVGTGYLIADRVDGIINEKSAKEMGAHDVEAFLAILGAAGVPALRQTKVSEIPAAMRGALAYLGDSAAGVLKTIDEALDIGGMGGGAGGLQLCYAGVGGDVAAGASVAGVVEGGVAGGLKIGPLGRGTTMMSMEGGASSWADPGEYREYGLRTNSREPVRNPKGRHTGERLQTTQLEGILRREYGIDPKGELGREIMQQVHMNLARYGNRNCSYRELVEDLRYVLDGKGITM